MSDKLSFKQFVAKTNDILEASTGNAFDMSLARKRLQQAPSFAGSKHDVERTSTGLKATRRFSDNDTAEAPKKSAAGGEPVKRGRGRPPGKYGSYKKKVTESLEILQILETEDEIEDFMYSLDEESFAQLAEYLENN